ncbi:MAG: hypothetical protein LKK46_08955, partial [Ancrocorticia sp.]|nr:hypothetical protein [Ancrocorticia sp.]MCI2194231.1 hypothetical protein [Ancrocorticia sp.]
HHTTAAASHPSNATNQKHPTHYQTTNHHTHTPQTPKKDPQERQLDYFSTANRNNQTIATG